MAAGGGAEGMRDTPADKNTGRQKRHPRVGFISSHFRWHSVRRLTVGLLEELGRSDRREIYAIDASRRDREVPDQLRSGLSQSRRHVNESGTGFAAGARSDPIRARLVNAGVSIVE